MNQQEENTESSNKSDNEIKMIITFSGKHYPKVAEIANYFFEIEAPDNDKGENYVNIHRVREYPREGAQ